ncbi:MAG TPA: Uma2 family endonuclease [Gemmataceae bacterium]|nr:Uma2 family endonuclease [Gemmataceae bacterium]
MSTARHTVFTEAEYEAAAQEYLRSLPLERFMEAIGQSTQRKITVESLDLVTARRPEVRVLSEMLVQYPVPGKSRPGQVVPDNMVVLSEQPLRADTCFNTPLEPAQPFWVLEYVSKHNKRKDYEDSFQKYERDLKVPYYLVFYPEHQELSLYRHNGKKYVSVKPNKHGRYAIKELDLEMALHEGWVRFWYEGQLLPLPAELDRRATEAERRATEEKQRADTLQRRLEEAERQLQQLAKPEQSSPRRTNGRRPGT